MNERRGRDQRIALGPSVRDMQLGASPRHHRVDRQDAAVESRQDLLIDLGTQRRSQDWIPSRDQQRYGIQFEHGDRREKEARHRQPSRPGKNLATGLGRSSQLRDDVRIENEHRERSAGLKTSFPTRGGSKSRPGTAQSGLLIRTFMVVAITTQRDHVSTVSVRNRLAILSSNAVRPGCGSRTSRRPW